MCRAKRQVKVEWRGNEVKGEQIPGKGMSG